MQPGVTGRLGSEGQQRVVGVFSLTAANAPARRRANRIAVQPFGHATDEGTGFGLLVHEAIREGGGDLVSDVLGQPGNAEAEKRVAAG
jgi:hypothetical protein